MNPLLPARTPRPSALPSVRFDYIAVTARDLSVGDVVKVQGQLARIATIGLVEAAPPPHGWNTYRRAQVQYLDSGEIVPHQFTHGFSYHRVYGGPKLYCANLNPRCIQIVGRKRVWCGTAGS